MAIINSSYNFIFIHVPKAAGTSVTKILSEYSNYCDLEIGGTHYGESIQRAYKKRFGLSKHSTAKEIKATIGAVDWSKKYSFAFVRNPYTRITSTYRFLLKWEGTPAPYLERLKSFESEDDFVESGFWITNPGPDRILLPQSHWLCADPQYRDLIVDFVGRMESLSDDISQVITNISTKKIQGGITVPKLNKSGGDTDINLSKKSIELINDHYRADFELFEYEFL